MQIAGEGRTRYRTFLAISVRKFPEIERITKQCFLLMSSEEALAENRTAQADSKKAEIVEDTAH